MQERSDENWIPRYLNVSTRSREKPLTVNVGGSMDLLLLFNINITLNFDVLK